MKLTYNQVAKFSVRQPKMEIMLLSQINNESKPQSAAFFHYCHEELLFSAAKILEKHLERNKLIITSVDFSTYLKLQKHSLKFVVKNRCLENFKKILMEMSVAERILFSLYPPKPDAITDVFLKHFLGTAIF